MIFRWNASDSMRKAEAIATGSAGPRSRETRIAFADLDPEQRAIVLEIVDNMDDLDKKQLYANTVFRYEPGRQFSVLDDSIEFDAEPTTADLIAAAAQQHTSYTEANAKRKAASDAAEAARQAEWAKAQAQRDAEAAAELANLQALNALIANFERDKNDPELAAIHLANLEQFKATDKDNRRTQADAVKAAWIHLYGSPHLRRGFAAGYDMQRRYATERAAMDAPAWILDFDGSHEWRNRSDPSPAALDAEEAAARLAETLAGTRATAVVWLTKPGTNEPDPQLRGAEEYNFDPCEAVTIDGYLGKYTLIKIID